jgi:hypothetical protein
MRRRERVYCAGGNVRKRRRQIGVGLRDVMSPPAPDDWFSHNPASVLRRNGQT